jgi:NADP-dependent 3-hydroxy acid dehydrogenase YdfG
VPDQAVYSATKHAVRAVSEELRKEAGDSVRVSVISLGFVATNFVEAVTNPEDRTQLLQSGDKFAVPPSAIARAVAFAIEQPPDVDVNEIVVRRPPKARPHHRLFCSMRLGSADLFG